MSNDCNLLHLIPWHSTMRCAHWCVGLLYACWVFCEGLALHVDCRGATLFVCLWHRIFPLLCLHEKGFAGPPFKTNPQVRFQLFMRNPFIYRPCSPQSVLARRGVRVDHTDTPSRLSVQVRHQTSRPIRVRLRRNSLP